ncbi:uncharacterized protein LOC128991758 [Macrosteles quadrilineatus]|uniref:uncharacterized protein LOC128991758 n=1 Tax=Macrosteles quadrilineatus TaxID=74068 RepID=UPI0023E33D17|nr:uncharacterized protein LOC128991758 [Macrosteles quadrilineatus]
MPWNYRDYIQLGLLVCCVPLQFYLSSQKTTTSENTNQEVLDFINEVRHFKQTWFSLKNWENTWTNILSWFVTNVLGVQKDVVDESPAVEVLEFRKKHGLKVKSIAVRNKRPPGLWFRVGQVVEHLNARYRGVIVEWNYDDAEETQVPVYRILLDESSVEGNEVAGVIDVKQDQLYLLKNTMIKNRFLKHYFIAYDGSQYIPLRWLQQLYPKD